MEIKYYVAGDCQSSIENVRITKPNVEYIELPQEGIEVNGVRIEKIFLKELGALYELLKRSIENKFICFQYSNCFFEFKELDESGEKSQSEEDFLDAEKVNEYGICDLSSGQNAKMILPRYKNVKDFGYKDVEAYFKAYEEKYDTKRFELFCRKLIEEGLFTEGDIRNQLNQEKLSDLCMLGMEAEAFNVFFLKLFEILASVHSELNRTLDPYARMDDYKKWFAFALQVYAAKNNDLIIKRYPVVQFKSIELQGEWKPAFKENNIALVLSSSNFYVIYLSAMIESIIENASDDNNYDITILESGITEPNKNILSSMAKGKENISIRFFNVTKRMSGIYLKAGGHISVETYYRLLIPYIFINYEKILFLDSDMTAHADVAELFNMDIQGYMVAAAHDQCIAAFCNGSDKSFLPYCREKLGIENYWDYFQAGVMLLNLNRMREKYTQEEIFEVATKRQYRYVDQDVMNVLCKGEVKHIPLRWNCFPDMGAYIYEYMPYYLLKEYEDARENPKICHHTGPVKPWSELFADDFMTDKFWSMSRNTPYFEQVFTRTVHGIVQQYFSNYEIMRPWRRGLRFIKNKIVIPIGMVFIKKDTRLYNKIKYSYYKFRGVELPTWELAKEEEE